MAYCGIVCSDCPVPIATQKNDDQERQRVAEMFTKQYGREYRPEDINSAGCVTDCPRIFSYCGTCKIRKCAQEKRVENCAFCPGYPCGMLSKLLNAYSKAKGTLDEIRHQHSLAWSSVG